MKIDLNSKRAVRPYREKHEELQNIFDSIPAMIVYKDRENRFLRVNQALCDVLGMSREELEGRSVFDVFPRKQAEAFWADDKEVMASGEPKNNIIEAMDIKGKTLWVRTDKIPYRDAEGNIIGVIALLIDITARKEAEDALRAAYAEEKRIRRENEQLVDQLKSALKKIRTLDSLLPVCSVCKKIRDEKGEWHYMEEYISSRTDTEFSHGVCPECAEKLYPRTRKCAKCGSEMEMTRFVNEGKHFRRYVCKKCGYSLNLVRKRIIEEPE